MTARVVARVVVVALVVLVVVAVVRYGALFASATEGDVPPAGSAPLPTGVTVVDATKACASGGCWTELTVRPPSGTSSERLVARLDGTRITGSLWDPRTVNVAAETDGDQVVVRADYWTVTPTP
ncbi:hypothetical protein [Curtobacterium sp. MCBA15_001]|uniref:hypothetical protein n=1 Tax=Curtobacterium sp. MCBA15_001 TaxID=1898731 RepID=UPI0008DC63A2|nr:hypothetical protein [Curtobacterium sp. MCBA15_001]OIH96229.1 hypothetical protein BIU90_00240 [Curtobacterium sp. MCBA15_001]